MNDVVVVQTSEAYTEEADGEGDGRGPESEESDSNEELVDQTVQEDMEKLQSAFPGFRDKYRLIKRIGEGGWHLLSASMLAFRF